MNIKKHFSAVHSAVLGFILAIAIYYSYLISSRFIILFAVHLVILAGYCYLLRDKIINIKKVKVFICMVIAISLIMSVPAFFRPKTGILGFHWKVYSVLGEYSAYFITFSIPLIVSTILFWFYHEKIHSVFAMVVAFIGGSLFIIPLLPIAPDEGISVAGFILLVLGCGFTGNCL